jgi:hypothetical protein
MKRIEEDRREGNAKVKTREQSKGNVAEEKRGKWNPERKEMEISGEKREEWET